MKISLKPAWISLLILPMATLSSGCSTSSSSTDVDKIANCEHEYSLENHIIEVSNMGRIANHDNSINCAFKNIAKTYAAQESENILVYFNGGMNPPHEVREQAKRQIPYMIQDGYFPIFMIWPTGLFDSYQEQVVYVRNGRHYTRPRYATAPFHVIGDIGQGIARAPMNYESLIPRFYQANFQKDETDYSMKLSDALSIKDDGILRPEQNVIYDKEHVDKEEEFSGGDFMYFATAPLRILTFPFVDSIGKTGWQNMVRRTHTTVRRPVEFWYEREEDDRKKTDEDKKEFPNGIGDFARFFAMLQSCMQHNNMDLIRWNCSTRFQSEIREKLKTSKVTLIGHSMGAIVINELISRFGEVNYENIIYMAGAASVKDTNKAISPLLKQRAGKTKFYNLALHPYNDATEVNAFGLAPAGSLLAWIDEMYENPKTMRDRTVGSWRNVRSTKHLFPTAAQRWMAFRVFKRPPSNKMPPNGQMCLEPSDRNPVTHGQFNDDEMCFWQPSFWGEDEIVAWPGT